MAYAFIITLWKYRIKFEKLILLIDQEPDLES